MSSAPTGASGPPSTAPPLPMRVVRAMLGQVAKAAPPRPVCEANAAPENPPARAPETEQHFPYASFQCLGGLNLDLCFDNS